MAWGAGLAPLWHRLAPLRHRLAPDRVPPRSGSPARRLLPTHLLPTHLLPGRLLPGRATVVSRDGVGVGVAVVATALSWVAVRTGVGDPVDRRARDLLARPLGPRADVAIGAATDLGSVYGLAGIAGALALAGRRRAAVDVAVAGLAAWSAAQALKPALDRPRPYQLDAAERLVAVPAGSSWPSGHSAVAAATATALLDQLPPQRRSAARVVATAYVGTVGVSRLYVGVHHLTDVVAGVAIGHLCGRAVRAVRRRLG